jgi:hypothetical protein
VLKISFFGNGQATRLRPTAQDHVLRKGCCAPLVMVNINGQFYEKTLRAAALCLLSTQRGNEYQVFFI